jgi:hypothetical protein
MIVRRPTNLHGVGRGVVTVTRVRKDVVLVDRGCWKSGSNRSTDLDQCL